MSLCDWPTKGERNGRKAHWTGKGRGAWRNNKGRGEGGERGREIKKLLHFTERKICFSINLTLHLGQFTTKCNVCIVHVELNTKREGRQERGREIKGERGNKEFVKFYREKKRLSINLTHTAPSDFYTQSIMHSLHSLLIHGPPLSSLFTGGESLLACLRTFFSLIEGSLLCHLPQITPNYPTLPCLTREEAVLAVDRRSRR